uniref:DUF1518 domain-containing protein n=1 Tax=Monopterus albus TaxID=43700 RepID=A0A3Q3IPC9_MONAL
MTESSGGSNPPNQHRAFPPLGLWPIGATVGPMMGQGVGPGRMVPSAALPTRGPPGSRAMVNIVFFLPSEMEMANPSYSQQQVPPNQTAPWPDRMMMEHYTNQSRCDIYSTLKHKTRGLEEIDKMLGIPTLAGQGPPSDQDQYLCSSDPAANMKPPLPPLSGHMGPQRMAPAGYPPVLRMPGSTGLRPTGMRPGAPTPIVPPQPNNLRLQLQHRLQAQLNRQPVVNQMSGMSNMNLPLRSNVPNQAQMLPQRQREYLSNHLRQRQQQHQQQHQQHMHQQRAMMMRTQGINMPPNMPSGGAAPTPMPMGGTNPRLPQGNPQQFPYSQQHQDPVSSFSCGAPAPQSPLLSPRMGQGQSSMLQQSQAPPGYQPSTDLNGWSQPTNISTSNSMYPHQSQPQYSTQPNTGMYSGSNMSQVAGQMSSMASMNTDPLLFYIHG